MHSCRLWRVSVVLVFSSLQRNYNPLCMLFRRYTSRQLIPIYLWVCVSMECHRFLTAAPCLTYCRATVRAHTTTHTRTHTHITLSSNAPVISWGYCCCSRAYLCALQKRHHPSLPHIKRLTWKLNFNFNAGGALLMHRKWRKIEIKKKITFQRKQIGLKGK